MSVVPLAVLWLGYQLTWYGYSLLRGPGMGFLDLMMPNRVKQAEAVIKGWSVPHAPSFAAPSYVQSPGVQPGSQYYPPNPQGGLPSKPPIGATPPAYYG